MSTRSSKQSIILKKANGKKTNSILAYGRDVRYRFCLFNLMMRVLFFDVRRKNNDAFFQKTVNNMTFQELLYADDILVIVKNTQTPKDYLRYIEEESNNTTT